MFLDSYLNCFRRYLKFCRIPGFTPYVWNKIEGKLEVSKIRISRLSYRLSWLVTLFYMILMTLRITSKKYSLLPTGGALMFIAGFAASVVLHFNWTLDPKYVNLLNTMCLFETQFKKKISKYANLLVCVAKIEKVSSFCAQLVAVFLSTAPLLYLPVVLVFPCNPPYSASWLSQCDDNSSQSPPVIVVCFFGILDMFVYFLTVEGDIFHGIYCAFFSIVSVYEYLIVLTRLLTMDLPSSFIISEYRTLNVLVNYLNAICGSTVFPGIFIFPWLCEMGCMFVFLRSISTFGENPFFSALFGSFSISMCLMSFVYPGAASKVFIQSDCLLNSLIVKGKRDNLNQYKKITIREVRATRLLRINVGDKFFDKTTPLIAQSFCMVHTASLLLL